MEPQKQQIKRQIAYKVTIKDIAEGQYTKNEGEWSPNYIEIGNHQVSRVNIIGTVVVNAPDQTSPHKSVVLDDGTGNISVRTFENNGIFDNVNIGDIVLVIGRPREFGTEKYLTPEVLKKVDNPDWIKVRQLELAKNISAPTVSAPQSPKEEVVATEPVVETTDMTQPPVEESNTPADKIFQLIKSTDSGEGADTEEVISKSNLENAEQLVKKLLEEGEIFEVKPGKLKILE
ncbi:MAG: hypothetical protein QF824_05905 [Candidatus Woesearchaeota archaeon]|jgi:hypothetical protein|nr:hypothetical protein [Candidatus Woesearchaeota archaeon]